MLVELKYTRNNDMYNENTQYNFDENYENVAFGWAQGFHGTTLKQELTIDTDNRLLIEIIPVDESVSDLPDRALFDDNYTNTDILVDTDDVLTPLPMDSRNMGIYADVEIE